MLLPVDAGVWTHAIPHVFMGLHLGTRMTVVRVASGDLWIHSPVALSPELRGEVEALGTVRHVVAPSLYHHSYAAQWQAAYPQAELYGPAALAKKRRDLRLTAPLETAREAAWASELLPVHIDGCLLDETVFVDAAARTLIGADVIENFASHPHFVTRTYLKAAGIYGQSGFSSFLRILFRDRKAGRRSIDSLLEHDFDRIVLAHGEILEAGGRAALERTYAFLGP